MIAFSQNRYHPIDEPAVALSNGGFLHGEGVFTTLKITRGTVPDLPDHWDRLCCHGRTLDLSPSIDVVGITEIIAQLIVRNGLEDKDARLRLTLSRQDETAWLTAVPGPLPTEIEHWLDRGIPVITLGSEYQRLFRPEIKSLNYLPSILALREARKCSCQEALICDGQGQVLEGAISNVFCVRGAVLMTPPADGRILPGLTRSQVLQLAEQLDLESREKFIQRADFHEADEVFMTNSVRGIVPVVRCDGRRVSTGIPGTITRQLQAAF